MLQLITTHAGQRVLLCHLSTKQNNACVEKEKKKSSNVQIQGTRKETPKSSHLDITVILNNRKEPSGRHRKGEWKQMKSLGEGGGILFKRLYTLEKVASLKHSLGSNALPPPHPQPLALTVVVSLSSPSGPMNNYDPMCFSQGHVNESTAPTEHCLHNSVQTPPRSGINQAW